MLWRSGKNKKQLYIALGSYTNALAEGCLALGYTTQAGQENNSGKFSVAIGNNSAALGESSIAIGTYINATSSGSIIIGKGYTGASFLTAPANSFAVGINSTVPTFYVSNSTGGATGTGKVGIATTTPGSAFQVNGNTAIGYSTSTAAPANGLLISGNTGMGTSSVGSKLQINGNAAIGYSSSTAAPANGLLISGNVGIGTTSATTTEKLTVNGKVKTNAIVLPDGEITSASGLGGWLTNVQHIYNSNLGGVGIGTNNPGAFKLSVNGNVNLLSDNGLNSLQILSNGQVPDRRGISLTNDPAGDFNFYVCS